MSCIKFRQATFALSLCLTGWFSANLATAQMSNAPNAVSSMTAKLTPFLPSDSAVFFMVRPSQLISSPIAQHIAAQSPQQRPSLGKEWEIEFAAAGVSAAALKDLPHAAATRTAPPSVQEAQFAVLVRFAHEVTSQQVLNLLRNAPNAQTSQLKYRIQEWNDTEILRCDDETAPAAWRIDAKTFIVADLHSFVSGLKASQQGTRNSPIWRRMAGQGKGDVAIGMDIEQAMAYAKNDSRAPKSIQKTDFVTIGFNLSKGDLLTVDALMKSAAAAKELSDGFQAMMMIVGMQATAAMDEETAEMIVPLLSSIRVENSGKEFHLTLPRPANFEQLVETLANSARQGKLPMPVGGF